MPSQYNNERPARILLIEDDAGINKLIELGMPELGIPHIFVGVLSAEEGLERWEQEPFDLLITDHNLPGMSGTDLIATLKSRGVTAPMVLYTAYDSPKLARKVSKLGASAFVAKPFLMEDMLDTIYKLLNL
jgi:DNA-binding NtrC family response regulator